MTLGERIRMGREAQGLSQEALAERMGISRQAVSKWEANETRPSTGNLLRLSQLLALDVRQLAADEPCETPQPGPADPPPKPAPPWRSLCLITWGAAVLALALLLPGLLGGPEQRPPADVSGAPPVQGEIDLPPEDPPLSIPLERERLYDFTPVLIHQGGSADEVLPRGWEKGALFTLNLSEDVQVQAAAVPSADRYGSAPQYDLWALFRTGPGAPWQVLYRFADSCERPEQLQAIPFTRLLGYDRGWKLFLPASAFDDRGFCSAEYIALDSSGLPVVVFTSASPTQERDIDGDGEQELVLLETYGWGQSLEIRDRAGGNYYLHHLQIFNSQEHLGLDDSGFYYLADPQGPRYPKLRGDSLWREDQVGTGGDPSWDAFAPDAADVTITFLYDQFSNGRDPDTSPGTAPDGTPLPTERQYARMALQTLYELTGQVPDSVFALATDFDIFFSTLEDGFAERSYFSLSKVLPRDDTKIPDLYITYHEQADWSPISAALVPLPKGAEEMTGQELAAAYYDRLSLMGAGPLAGQPGSIPYYELPLTLTDGRWYRASVDEALHVLTYLQGPYPADFCP